MATILGTWNDALRLCKLMPLASTSTSTGTVEPHGTQLADAWSGGVQYMLEQAQWSFAKVSTSVAGSTAGGLGYAYNYTKPSNLVRLTSISASTAYYPPVEHYDEDAAKFYGSNSTIYLTFTSNSTSYGFNHSLWPETFAKATAAYLATQIAPQISAIGKEDMDRLEGEFQRRLATAKAKDAINQTHRVEATSRESIYQGAMRIVGFRRMNRFADDALARRVRSQMPQAEGQAASGVFNQEMTDELTVRTLLDESFDNAVAYIIEQGLWNWAQRVVAIDSATDVEPEFGYSFAFEIPDDFVRLESIAANDRFWPALQDFREEGGYWLAYCDPLFVSYISSDETAGTDMNAWPRAVKLALEWYLAKEIAPSLRLPAVRIAQIDEGFRKALRDARSKDAANQGANAMQPGRLSQSRNGRLWRWDRR